MRFDIITIFPGFFAGILEHGVLKRAIQGGLLAVEVHDLREFAHDRHRTVDDRPFGGGEGMVLKPEPLAEAVEHLGVVPKAVRAAHQETVILLSAQGRKFSQGMARDLALTKRVVLLYPLAIMFYPEASWPLRSCWTPPCGSCRECWATRLPRNMKALGSLMSC
jgi:tRNA (guanine37-N1)-methyltransferase